MNFAKKMVTPAMASEYLKKNIGTNRYLNQTHIEKLATEIREGRWVCLPHGIVFDTNNRLIDGQHRLHAIVAANRPVQMIVVTGASPDTLESLDTGSPRGVHDLATVTGRVSASDSGRYAARARAVHSVLHTGRLGQTFSLADFDAVLETYRDNIEWSIRNYGKVSSKAGSTSRRVRSALVMGAAIVSHHKAPTSTEAFIERADSGIGLTADDPAYALRRYLDGLDVIGGPTSKRAPVIYATLRACHAAAHGHKLSVIRPAYLTRENPEFARMLKFFGLTEEA